MSYTHIASACLYGSVVVPVSIEVDIQPGLPQFTIIGLPDRQIEEAKLRVKTAIKNSGFPFPNGRLTINLAPSNIPKQGTGFDLGIALGILSATGKVTLPSGWVMGELGLEGDVRSYQHLFPILVEAKRQKVGLCIVPCLVEAVTSLVPISRIEGSTLRELVLALENGMQTCSRPLKKLTPSKVPDCFRLDVVHGQLEAKRALAVALAGGHHLLLNGPAGVGKSMLAEAAAELLPDLSYESAVEVASLHCLHLQSSGVRLNVRPPFRAPHHTVSVAGLIGGGSTINPGEMSLAHRGILFLDECNNLSAAAKEALKQPLQDKVIRLHRQGKEFSFPANCLVIMAQNPCPCGRHGSQQEKCLCSPGEVRRFQDKMPVPILDRLDMSVQVDMGEVIGKEGDAPLSACAIREKILYARNVQQARQGREILNAHLSGSEIEEMVPLIGEVGDILHKAMKVYSLSMRGIHKVLRVAQTIADMEGFVTVGTEQIQEALRYRLGQSVH